MYWYGVDGSCEEVYRYQSSCDTCRDREEERKAVSAHVFDFCCNVTRKKAIGWGLKKPFC